MVGLSLTLPFLAEQASSPGQKVPEKPPYAVAWTQAVESPGPLQLAAMPAVVVLHGALAPVQARLAADGTLAWTAPIRAESRVTGGDGMVFVIADDALHALAERTGAEHWRAPVPEPSAAPTWTPGGILVPSGQEVLAIRVTDGGIAWRAAVGARTAAPVIVAGQVVVAPLVDASVVALGLRDGRELWRRRTGTPPGPLVAVEGRLHFATANGTVVALDLTDGSLLWEYPLRVPVIGAVEADAGRAYAAFMDNTVRAFDGRVGNDRWRTPLDARPIRGVRLIGNRLFVALATGELITLAAETGQGRRVIAGRDATAITPGTRLESAAALADGSRMYALTWTNATSYTLLAFDPAPVGPGIK